MKKNILMAIAALGGLVLIALLLADTPTDSTNDQNEEAAATTLPTDIPGFPIYPNKTIESVTDTTSETARDVSLSLHTTDSMTDIHDWYRSAFKQGSWSIKSDKNIGGYQMIQAEKDNLFTSLQTASGDANTVVITQHLKIRK